MAYNFDEFIDRRSTNSLKYDFAVERGGPDAPEWLIPLRVRPSIGGSVAVNG